MKIIDLTIPLDKNVPLWDESERPDFLQVASIEKDGFNKHDLHISTHLGTHIDAPWHFLKNKSKLGGIRLENLVSDAIVIDCRKYKEIPVDAAKNANIKNKIVFFYTGHSKKTKPEYVKNWPVLSEYLAKFLVKNKVKAVGVDTLSPDNEPYNVHRILLDKEIPIIENLVNLDQLINKKFQAVILPLKLDLDGAPCRAIALV